MLSEGMLYKLSHYNSDLSWKPSMQSGFMQTESILVASSLMWGADHP